MAPDLTEDAGPDAGCADALLDLADEDLGELFHVAGVDLRGVERLVVPAGRGDHGDLCVPGDRRQGAYIASHAPARQFDDEGETELLPQRAQLGGHRRRVASRVEDGCAVALLVQVEDEVLVGEGRAAYRSGCDIAGDGAQGVRGGVIHRGGSFFAYGPGPVGGCASPGIGVNGSPIRGRVSP